MTMNTLHKAITSLINDGVRVVAHFGEKQTVVTKENLPEINWADKYVICGNLIIERKNNYRIEL